jgi:Tol biopolymer transport system component/Zn-dependent M28 family amino/carboxypeptidase
MNTRPRSATGRPRVSALGFVLPLLALPLAAGELGCSSSTAPATRPAQAEQKPGGEFANETHFGALVQLTDGGDNSEPYWAFGGNELMFQAHDGSGCNQIYALAFDHQGAEPRQVSSGKGASAGARFLPGDQEIVYASTELAGDACAPPLDGNPGNAWPLSSSYDIMRANVDGSHRRSLTAASGATPAAPSYDGEASVCSKDGSILFTSSRDGDLDLYRMDSSGQNVKRVTQTPGYDGRAFFSRDCEKIVWQASRPTGQALKEYQDLLAKGLVRPSNLEIFVANADGSEARQLTYFGAQSFAPFFAPSGSRVLFSSNVGDPQRREFDIWALDTDGTHLEQITYAPGFDGYPMFSPDGKYLAFSSSRSARPGSAGSPVGSTPSNVFVAEWKEGTALSAQESPADRVMRDIAWLADPARDGRGVGTPGLEAAGAYIEARFKALGLEPAASPTSYRQTLDVVSSVQVGPGTALAIAGTALPSEQFQPLGFSASGEVAGKLVLAGYGIQKPELGRKDLDGAALKGNIAVMRRFVPDTPQFKDVHSELREKAWGARDRGARALIIVDSPERPPGAAADWKAPDDAVFPHIERDSYGDAGIPVLIVKRAAFASTLEQLEKGRTVNAQLKVELTLTRQNVFNVLARLPARAPADQRLPGVFVVGAHYDHLGHGGSFSLAPDDHSAHVGADDNASGVALVLEVARQLSQVPAGDPRSPRRDIVFATFTGEEMGSLGSSHLLKNPPPGLETKNLHAMINFDMVGRLRENKLLVMGAASADEWQKLVPPLCEQNHLECKMGSALNSRGGSDHDNFYAAGVPVLHFFTDTHSDYHKPSDVPSKINAAGVAQIAQLTEQLLEREDQRGPLTFRNLPAAKDDGKSDRRSFNASLGTIPDYGGPPNNQKGVLLSGVRPGSGAALGGMQRGDILVQLGDRAVDSVEDLMFCLNNAKPNQTVKAVVLREGKRVELKVTYQERGGGGGSPHSDPNAAPGAAASHGATPAATPPGSGHPDPGHAPAPAPSSAKKP